jgi:hypothetical protein
MWTGDQYKGTNNGAPFIVVDWVGTNVSWFPSQNFASTNAYNGAWPDKYYRVRCIGIADRTGLTPPVAGEFVHEAEFVAAHASDQSLVTYLDAIDLCRGAGGHVIDNLEALSLVVGGLPNGSGLGMWTAEHGDLAMLTMYWNDQEPYIWPPNAFVGTGETGFGQDWFSLTSHPYRCIFYATQEWVEPTDCKGNCFVVHQGNSYQALDREDRTPVTYFQAADHCRAFGARLPSTRDLEEAIRLGLPNGTGVGIWSTSSHVSDNSGPPKLVVRWTGSNQFWSPPNDFASGLVGYNSAFPGETKPYRCVWTNEVH